MAKFERIAGTIDLVARSGKAFTLEGDGVSWYSVYKAAQLQGAQKGDDVTFEFDVVTKGGKDFLNVQGNVDFLEGSESAPAPRAARPARGAAPAPRAARTARPVASEAPSEGREDKRQRSIVRQNSLTNANALFATLGRAGLLGESSAEELAQEVLAVARVFEEFSMVEDA